MAVGNLDIQLSLDAASFSSNMKKATADLEKFTSSAEQIKNIAIGNFISQVAVGALQELSRSFTDIIAKANEWNAIAKKLGGGDDLGAAIQGNVVALAGLGIAFDTGTAGMQRFGVAMQETLRNGLTPGKAGFQALGVSVTDAAGQFLPFNTVMDKTIQALAAMPPGVERNTAAMQVFGKTLGAEVIARLDELGPAFRQSATDAAANAEAWQKLGSTMDEISAKMGAVAINALTPLAEGFLQVVNDAKTLEGGFDNLVAACSDLIGQIGNVIDAFFKVGTGASAGASGMQTMMGVIAALINSLMSLVRAAAAAAKALAALGNASAAVDRLVAAPFSGDVANEVKGAAKDAVGAVTQMGDAVVELDRITGTAAKGASDAWDMQVAKMKLASGMQEQLNEQKRKDLKLSNDIAKANRASVGAGETRVTQPKKGGGGGGKKKGGGGAGKSDEEKSVEQLQKFIDKTREAEGSTLSFKLAMEENMAKAHEALQKGLISPEEEARFKAFFDRTYELKVAKATGIANMTSILDDLQKGFESFGKSAASSLADAIVEGDSLEDTLKALLKQLVKMIIQLAILEPLMNSIFGKAGIGGMLGGMVGGLAMPMAAPLAPPARIAAPLAGIGPAARSGIVRSSGSATANARRAVSGVTVKQDVGPMTINMDTGKVKATSEQGAQLGEKIRASVQQILVQEQRAGGILSGRR